MSGLFLPDVRELWVKPALAALPAGMATLSAQQGVLGIGLKESGYIHLRQIGTGPALGFWQMEPNTHDDMWRNFIAYRPGLKAALMSILNGIAPHAWRLIDNPIYAAAMCRLHLFRQSAPLPAANDAVGWAADWKNHYNTAAGAGVADQATPIFRAAMEA